MLPRILIVLISQSLFDIIRFSFQTNANVLLMYTSQTKGGLVTIDVIIYFQCGKTIIDNFEKTENFQFKNNLISSKN